MVSYRVAKDEKLGNLYPSHCVWWDRPPCSGAEGEVEHADKLEVTSTASTISVLASEKGSESVVGEGTNVTVDDFAGRTGSFVPRAKRIKTLSTKSARETFQGGNHILGRVFSYVARFLTVADVVRATMTDHYVHQTLHTDSLMWMNFLKARLQRVYFSQM